MADVKKPDWLFMIYMVANGSDKLDRVAVQDLLEIEQGIAKGGLKRPEDAKLRLGMAQQQSSRAKVKAAQTLRSVQGNDGSADIARLWLVLGST